MEFLCGENQWCACMRKKMLACECNCGFSLPHEGKWVATSSVSEECDSLSPHEGNWVRDIPWESVGSKSDSPARTDGFPYSPFPKEITTQLLLGELSGWLNKTRKVVGS